MPSSQVIRHSATDMAVRQLLIDLPTFRWHDTTIPSISSFSFSREGLFSIENIDLIAHRRSGHRDLSNLRSWPPVGTISGNVPVKLPKLLVQFSNNSATWRK